MISFDRIRNELAIQTMQECSEPKPLLRGWSHVAAALASLFLTVAMAARTTGDLPRMLSVVAFGASMVLLFTVSALLHRYYWSGCAYTRLVTLDHANIFFVIAGAYTPLLVTVLGGRLGAVLLGIVWGLALGGALGARIAHRLPRWACVAQYFAMGLLSLPLLPALAAALPAPALALLLGGGLTHAVGGAIYALRRPNPIPHIFGYHEIFHLLVVIGHAAIAAVVWVWVIPFGMA